MNGAELITEERQRQILVKGFTLHHDAHLDAGVLANAGACYILADDEAFVEKHWFFDEYWWKPTTRLRNLVKAGALIAAEIDQVLIADGRIPT